MSLMLESALSPAALVSHEITTCLGQSQDHTSIEIDGLARHEHAANV